MRESMGMASHVFRSLVHELKQVGLHDTHYVTAKEQVAIFLRLMVYGNGNREAQECFQWSADTISKAFHCVLQLTCSGPFYTKFVHLPDDEVAEVIMENEHFAPFSDCR